MTDNKHYTEANRKAWNETMPRHQKANGDKWDKAFQTSGHTVFTEKEKGLLTSLPVTGKRIAHLCCNNGVELMSLKNMGAAQCTGFDISDEAIMEAAFRSKQTGIHCEFVRTDIYDISATYHQSFDVIYISIGCFGWMPDIDQFFAKVRALLDHEGKLFIHEMHPFSGMLASDQEVAEGQDPLKIIYPYFKHEPYEENDGIDYVGKTSYQGSTKYWFAWTLSDIMTSIMANKMAIRHFKEYEEDISASHQKTQATDMGIPLSYTLIADVTA